MSHGRRSQFFSGLDSKCTWILASGYIFTSGSITLSCDAYPHSRTASTCLTQLHWDFTDKWVSWIEMIYYISVYVSLFDYAIIGRIILPTYQEHEARRWRQSPQTLVMECVEEFNLHLSRRPHGSQISERVCEMWPHLTGLRVRQKVMSKKF